MTSRRTSCSGGVLDGGVLPQSCELALGDSPASICLVRMRRRLPAHTLCAHCRQRWATSTCAEIEKEIEALYAEIKVPIARKARFESFLDARKEADRLNQEITQKIKGEPRRPRTRSLALGRDERRLAHLSLFLRPKCRAPVWSNGLTMCSYSLPTLRRARLQHTEVRRHTEDRGPEVR